MPMVFERLRMVDGVEINQDLVKRITQKVMEELNKLEVLQNDNSDFKSMGTAFQGKDVKEVVIGIAPAFGSFMNNTIAGLNHKDVMRELMAGIEEEGMIPRVVRVLKTSDVCFIGKEVAVLSGSGVGIGIQSKGTTVIHQKDLYPLTNLELFPQAPLITLNTYRQIGKNAARYAKGVLVKPIPVENDFMVRAKYQVKAALMHIKETEHIIKDAASLEIKINF